MAEAAGCQKSYFTLVLKGTAHLTLEQAERLCRFWQLSAMETKFYLLLVNHARAGSAELQSHYFAQLSTLRAEQEEVVHRLKKIEAMPDTQAAIYYSNWLFLAVHIAISIPRYQSPKDLSARLDVPEEGVLNVLRYLEDWGLADHVSGKWISTRREFHLSKDSHFISLHHGNWRRRAVDNAFIRKSEDVHFTAVSSLSVQDASELKEMVLRFIEQTEKLIAPSQEEDLICLNIDCFRV